MAAQFTLQVHITSACDSHCAHCYQRDAVPFHMSATDFRLLLDQYDELLDSLANEARQRPRGLVTITGGEPLIHPDFRQLVFAVWAHGFDLAVLTNGHFIDESTAVLLRNASFVQVSLDGTREIHDANRGTGDFDRVTRAIRTLKDARANVIVSFTAHKGNYRCLPEAAVEAKRAGANRFWSDRYLPLVDEPLLQALDPGQTVEYLELLGKAADKRRGVVVRHRALQFMCGGRPYACHAGRDILAVTETCKVLPCKRLPIPCGDFRETPLCSLYNTNQTLITLRETQCPAECKKCVHADSCAGGLRCLSAAVTGDWNTADPGCPLANGVDATVLEPLAASRKQSLKKVRQAPPKFRGAVRIARMFKQGIARNDHE